MTRIEQSCAARNMMGEDFFGGWEDSDIELFGEFAKASEPSTGKITDFLGIKTSTGFHPWARDFDNTVIGDLPFPDDSLRAEAIEYFALFDALRRSPPDAFALAEVGSSYGPWTCAAAVCAQRMGKSDIRLSAVEASSFLFGLIPIHLAENEVDPSVVRLINGAAAPERTKLFFPKVLSPGDNGGQASAELSDTDYLNRTVEHEAVEAYPLADLLPEGIVDLIHIDVQGHEFDVLNQAIDSLDQRVRSIFVGTHSRKIEGQLLELFHAHGWQLVRERPTRFAYSASHRDIVAWTTRDGGQYWTNPALAID
jgi:FkbM family methyltransferase